MLLEQVCEGFVGKLLQCRHSVASKLRQLVERVIIEGDQFTHVQLPRWRARTLTQPSNRSSLNLFPRAELAPAVIVEIEREISMTKLSMPATLVAAAILILPISAFAQSAGGAGAGGASAGTGSAAGSPNAGSAGAGTSATSGVPSGPANVGGLNNSINDPSGVGNASRVASPPPPGINSAGTANSSGMTTGTGSGATSMTDAPRTGNADVDAQDRAVDRKIKSICKGC
jgi:hypothetical protein